jgi:hypothetical protein
MFGEILADVGGRFAHRPNDASQVHDPYNASFQSCARPILFAETMCCICRNKTTNGRAPQHLGRHPAILGTFRGRILRPLAVLLALEEAPDWRTADRGPVLRNHRSFRDN